MYCLLLFMFISAKRDRKIKGIAKEQTDILFIVCLKNKGTNPAMNALIKEMFFLCVISKEITQINMTNVDARIFGINFPTKVSGRNRLKKAKM